MLGMGAGQLLALAPLLSQGGPGSLWGVQATLSFLDSLAGRRRRAEECGFEECLTQGRNSTLLFFFHSKLGFSARSGL